VGTSARAEVARRGTVMAGDLKLLHCPVFLVNGALRATLPARPLFGPDGKHLADPGTGKLHYEPIIEWRTRAAADAFSEAVVDALLLEHPEVAR
jgi:hypothetical protein